MKRVLPHGLRHACAVELVIQQQLGHASQHTTTICLRYIAPVELDSVATVLCLNDMAGS